MYSNRPKSSTWQARYSKIYSATKRTTRTPNDTIHRISFITKEKKPLNNMFIFKRTAQDPKPGSTNEEDKKRKNYDTALLEMVRARSKQNKIMKNKCVSASSINTESSSLDDRSDGCGHGFNMRQTERSFSRSRISRLSTRRDMDVHSILTCFTTVTPVDNNLIPAFKKPPPPVVENPTSRWSIRRSVCPVCSQKWRDKSTIAVVKNSGLKRNSSADFPISIMAPARLRSSIKSEYIPRPVLAAVDENTGVVLRGWRNSSSTWQLTRARRIFITKPNLPDINQSKQLFEKNDLEARVTCFLADFQNVS